MVRPNIRLSGHRRLQRGYLLLELLLAFMVALLTLALAFNATSSLRYTISALHDGWQLQEAERHIAAQLEKALAYDAQSITLQSGSKISYSGIQGNKQYTLYADSRGVYLRTRTGKGTGINPVSLAEVDVSNWQVQRLAEHLLRLSYTLSINKSERQVVHYFTCYNAVIADDG